MSSRFPSRHTNWLIVACAIFCLSCERQTARYDGFLNPGRLDRPMAILSELAPGDSVPRTPVRNPFEGDARALAEGRRLYNWYNCAGCHFNGGGGIGPALMDDAWIYGSEPEQIYDSIVRGRPNGMPAFAGRVPERQVWQIAAYVRSLNPDQKRPNQGQGAASRPEGGGNR